MPSSRSAKEICAEEPNGISCRIAKDRERRMGTPAEAAPPARTLDTKPENNARQRKIQDAIRRAGG